MKPARVRAAFDAKLTDERGLLPGGGSCVGRGGLQGHHCDAGGGYGQNDLHEAGHQFSIRYRYADTIGVGYCREAEQDWLLSISMTPWTCCQFPPLEEIFRLPSGRRRSGISVAMIMPIFALCRCSQEAAGRQR